MMKAAVGLSGGVDSAAAAHILKNRGYEVMGITLRLKPGNLTDGDIEDARRVADGLDIPLTVLDLRDFFEKNIINDFSSEYLSGRTPNPCIECNKLVKFGSMLDFALESGCDALATGHYARIEEKNGEYFLRRTGSPKDQSYFLYRLNQAQLSRIIFPLADMDKEQIRAEAARAGISVAAKRDSQEICFVPDDDYVRFLTERGISSPTGNFVDGAGNILGKHNGIINYTVGQRKGLGAFGRPMFVNSIDPVNNTVVIGENGTQYSPGLTADCASWISGKAPREPFRANVKIRFRAPEQPALIIPRDENSFSVRFDEPQRSVTPGQAAVILDGDTVLGGGRIITQGE